MGKKRQTIMTGEDFLNSKWVQEGASPEGEAHVRQRYDTWKKRVRNTGLLERASQLWTYLTSGQVTAGDKAIIIGALLYLICPLDLMPDWFPVFGWLDDLGVAGFALSYLLKKIDETDLRKPICDVDIPVTVGTAPNMTGGKHSPLFKYSYEGLSYYLTEMRQDAEELGMSDISAMSLDLEDDLQGGIYRVLFAGRYNTGKSTLINAFLRKEWLPTGPIPTTRAITHILAGKREALFSEQPEGDIVVYQQARDLMNKKDSTIQRARRVTLILPPSALPDGVVIVDSPGLEDPQYDITELTLQEAPIADAIVVVLDARYPESEADQRFVQGLVQQDRERKLFFVLNRMDTLSPQEHSKVKASTYRWLAGLHIPEPRIFCLSATIAMTTSKNEVVDPDFARFREELLAFLQHGAPVAMRQGFYRRADLLRDGLLDACDGIVSSAENTNEKRRQDYNKAREVQEKLKVRRSEQEDALDHKVDVLQEVFFANLSDYLGTLGGELNDIIDKAESVNALPTNNEIEAVIKDGLKRFTESEITKVAEQLDTYTSEQIEKIQIELHKVALPVQVERTQSLLEKHPEIVSGGVLLTAWSTVSFLSFIYVVVGVAFGRNVIETMVKNISSEMALRRVRPELKQQLTERLREIKPKLQELFEAGFEDMRKEVKARLHNVEVLGTCALQAIAAHDDQSITIKAKRAAEIKERLLTFTSPEN